MHRHTLGQSLVAGAGRELNVEHLREKGVVLVFGGVGIEVWEADLEGSWDGGVSWEKLWTGVSTTTSGMLVGGFGEVLALTHVRFVVTTAPAIPGVGSGGVSGWVQGWS